MFLVDKPKLKYNFYKDWIKYINKKQSCRNIMSSQVLALKYRPKRFEDLIGQKAVSQTLSLALDSNRLSHAYLFSGLRGSGKTSTARIFSKSLLCEQGPTSKPCEKCENCIGANNGNHIDIIEMDAASNRGIDDIKELIEHTKYKPSIARYKVFIIDEVHMLTIQAFNALLKTLEEPPMFVKFILATTDPLKLPPTILSRTQHFRFKNIALKDIIHHLSHILHLENVEYETESLEVIARSGNGSLRDTLTLLDQAIIFSKGSLDISSVTDMLGIVDPKVISDIFDTVLNKDTDRIIDIASALQEYETSAIIDEMINFLKTQMIHKNPKFSNMLYDRFFRVLSDAKSLLYINSNDEFVLLLTLNKLIEASNIYVINEAIGKLEQKVEQKSFTHLPNQAQTPDTPDTKAVLDLASQSNEPAAAALEENSQPREAIEEIKNKPDIPAKHSEHIEHIEQADRSEHTAAHTADGAKEDFKKLTALIYDRDYGLGKCFEENIEFGEFKDGVLSWVSYAHGNDQLVLKNSYSHIKHFVQQIFGIGTKINFKKGEKKNDAPQAVDKHSVRSEEKQDSLDDENHQAAEAINADENMLESCGSCMENTLCVNARDIDANTMLNSQIRQRIEEGLGITKIRVISKM
jgi:DNA polymerase-3 subunit gamma/tau